MLGAMVLGALFVWAAMAKLARIDEFERVIDLLLITSLERAHLPLAQLRVITTIGVIVVESVIGTALIVFGARPRVPAMAACAVLLVFCGILIYMATMESPPSCGCLGGWDLVKRDARTSAYLGLVRNAGLLGLAGWLATPSVSSRARANRPLRRANRPAFTIIEMLLAIAIVGVLIAILVPALARAKHQAKETDLLSALRQCYAGIAVYTTDERGYFPYLGVKHQPEIGALPGTIWEHAPPPYFRGQAFLWPTALLRQGTDLSGLPNMTLKQLQQPRIHTYLWMTHAAHARPEYWVGEDVPQDSQALYAGVRIDEATFPANKGLLIDVAMQAQDSSVKVGFVDGSVSFRSTQAPSMDVEYLNRPYGAVPWRVLTTPEGMRGRDY